MKKLLNFEYACIHGTFWMVYGVISSFASVFLLDRDYSNWEIGMILAVANVLAVVLQPFVADMADRSKKISIIGITEIMTVMMMVMTFGLFVLKRRSMALAVIFVLLVAWHTVLQPLVNSLTFKLEESGVHINFGVARSMGSLAYSVLVAVLGTLVEHYGVSVMPVTAEITMVMLLISLVLTKHHFDKTKEINTKNGTLLAGQNGIAEADCGQNDEEEINLTEFIRRNKVFFIVNIGVIGLFFSNAILNSYMMQIVADVGGDSEDMGRILSVMAFLEIPTMVCFDWLRKRFSCQLMLKVASIGFVFKIGLCYLASSVSMIFVAQFFQLISFALFLPGMVHFTDEIMSKGEAVKGQALFTMMVTVTTVFASLFGGAILDMSGAKTLALIATLATVAGAAVVIGSIDKVKH